LFDVKLQVDALVFMTSSA